MHNLWTGKRWGAFPLHPWEPVSDSVIHRLIYIHVRACNEFCHLVKCRSLFYLSIYLSLSPSLSHGWTSLWCFLKPSECQGGLNLENSALLLCSSAKVKCCVLVWILPVSCNTHNFWQMLTGGIYSDLYCWYSNDLCNFLLLCFFSKLYRWLRSVAKQHHLSWQTSTASYYIRYERGSKDGSTWHIQIQKHRRNA